MKSVILQLSSLCCISMLTIGNSLAQVSPKVLDSISTPNTVETSIGSLEFFGGAPLPETAATVYDYLDRMLVLK